jgi:hypothetical protein
LRAAFQHHPSNTPDRRARERQKSAIPRALVDQLRIRVLEHLVAVAGRADRPAQGAGRGPEIAKTFAASPPIETAGGPIGALEQLLAAISAGQNIRRKDEFDQVECGGSKLEPLWNRNGTSNYMTDREKEGRFHSSKIYPSRICARDRAHRRARITRGKKLEPLEPRELASKFNAVGVPRQFQSGSSLEPSPAPSDADKLARPIHGTPTGRGQQQNEKRGGLSQSSGSGPRQARPN